MYDLWIRKDVQVLRSQVSRVVELTGQGLEKVFHEIESLKSRVKVLETNEREPNGTR